MDNLPDILDFNLKILFIGFNPGLRSASLGHHYAGKSNNFWKLLYESHLTPYKFDAKEDRKLLELGYGSTNIANRPTKSAAELDKSEFEEGSVILKSVLQKYKPRIACYVGIGVYRAFTGKKGIECGIQSESAVDGVIDYVCSSPSGLNRISYADQLSCFMGLKELLEQTCRVEPDDK